MSFALIPGFGSFGGVELIIALVIILLLFGAKRVPELMKGLGSGVREFRKGTREDIEEKNEKEAEKIDSGQEGSSAASNSDEEHTASPPQEDASAEQEKRS